MGGPVAQMPWGVRHVGPAWQPGGMSRAAPPPAGPELAGGDDAPRRRVLLDDPVRPGDDPRGRVHRQVRPAARRMAQQSGTCLGDEDAVWHGAQADGRRRREPVGPGLGRAWPQYAKPRQKILKLAASAGIKIKGRGRMKRPPARRHETPLAVATRTSDAPRRAPDPYRYRREAPENPGRRVHRQRHWRCPMRRNCRTGSRPGRRSAASPPMAPSRPMCRGSFHPAKPGSRRPDTAGAAARNRILRRSKRAGRTIWR